MMKKIGLIVFVGLVGCAKSPNYETVYKAPELTSISEKIDTSAEYLYVPSTLGTPREITQVNAFFQGQPKIVRIKLIKEGIIVFEENPGTRGRDNELNNIPILTIPGTYHSFKCVENQLGECTNREEENDRLEWNQKSYFTPDFENLKVTEINPLDFSSGEADSCLTNAGTRLVDYQMEKGLINIELEKTYKVVTSESCLKGDLKNQSFNVRFYYSLVKLQNLTSQDYEPIKYPLMDQKTFGFFAEKSKIEDDTLHDNRKEFDYLLKRWNPKKGKIVYNLGKNFNKPENNLVKELTYKGIESINKSLELSGAGFRIELNDQSNLGPGDIRNSVINLMEEPMQSGLLGYGPIVANPRTGEIIRGSINMYSGVLRLTLRGLWDEMASITRKGKKLENTPAIDSDEIPVAPTTSEPVNRANLINSESRSLPHRTNISFIKDRKNNFSITEKMIKTVNRSEDRLKLFSDNCAFVEEFLNSTATAKNLLPGIENLGPSFYKGTILKKWNELTANQKKIAENFIFPFVYTTTLIHEMGHNLGLRHNFGGSFDKANFFSEKEAKNLGFSHAPKYSSIMDYTGNDMEEILHFGKYDLAALRFGYARKVEGVDGNLIPVKQTLAQTLSENQEFQMKAFFYCTDENEGLTPHCNKFDQGTNYTEIAESIIDRYESTYEFLNFRDGRNVYNTSFSDLYFDIRYRQFKQLRSIFEDWKSDTRFGEQQKIYGCTTATDIHPLFKASCDDLNDKINASKLAGKFFIKILKTPDHLCALAYPRKPNETVKLEPLSSIQKNLGYLTKGVFKSCFDPVITEFYKNNIQINGEEYVVKGEVGKFLNHQLANDPDFTEIEDRGAMGIWIDKLLASKFLFQRFDEVPAPLTPTDEKQNHSLLIFPELDFEIKNLFAHFVAGEQLFEPLNFVDKDGNEYVENLPYKLTFEDKINQADIGSDFQNTFNLEKMANPSIQKSILENARNWEVAYGGKEIEAAKDHVDFFTVGKRPQFLGNLGEPNFSSTLIDRTYMFANDKNVIASKMIKTIELSSFLESLDKEKIKKVFDMVTKPPYLDTMSAIEKRTASMRLDALKYLRSLKEKDPKVKNNYFKEYLRQLKIPSTKKASYKDYWEVFGLNTIESFDNIIKVIEDYDKELETSFAEDRESKTIKLLSKNKVEEMEKYFSGDLKKEKDLYVTTLKNLPETPYYE